MKTTNTTTKTDAYQIVTDRIVAQLEQGIIPWHKPWIGGSLEMISGNTGRPYSLLNQMLLTRPGKYFTFKQAKDLGASVRKGEKASYVFFWKQYEKAIDGEYNDDGSQKTECIPVLKWYTVFHESQIDNLPESKRSQPDETPGFDVVPDEAAEALIANYTKHEHIALHHYKGGDKACYSPSFDEITLPEKSQFEITAEYYSTAFHEMTHSTGHASRLNRLTKTARFGSQDYSKEELVAEIGSAFLMNLTGNEIPQTMTNSAAYIQSWLKAIKNDKRLVVSAASKAQKAADFILAAAEAQAAIEPAANETVAAEPAKAPDAAQPAAKKPAAPALTAAEKLEKKYSKAPTKAQRIAAAKRICKTNPRENITGVQYHANYTAIMGNFSAIRFFNNFAPDNVASEIAAAIPAAMECTNIDRFFSDLTETCRSDVEQIGLPTLADVRRYVADSRKCKGTTAKMLAENLYCDFALLLDLLTICPDFKAYRKIGSSVTPIYFTDPETGIDAILCPVRIPKPAKKAA